MQDQSPRGSVLLKSMVTMAHELGLSVVAEGVVDAQEAEQLLQIGCEYVQSFHFGAPADAETSLKLLLEQNPVAVA